VMPSRPEGVGPTKPPAATTTTRWRTRRRANRPASVGCRIGVTVQGGRRGADRTSQGDETMNKKAQTKLDKLKLALHGETAPFSCEGAFVPDKAVTIVFKDNTRFEVVRAKSSFDQERELGPLLGHCKPAPFGAGKRTRYDRSVRDALQLKAEREAFRVENFDPESAGLLKKIQRGLVPHDPSPISAELSSVNVYTSGGHFAPHKDTPRGNDMFGTLVVCLPSQFGNGKFVLTHRGIVQKFDWGSAISAQKVAKQLHWAAFFGDVDHQIERIWSGARVTLTYLLRRGAGGEPSLELASEDLAPRVQEAWRGLLAGRRFLPWGGKLALVGKAVGRGRRERLVGRWWVREVRVGQ